jgi:hypothetical protein
MLVPCLPASSKGVGAICEVAQGRLGSCYSNNIFVIPVTSFKIRDLGHLFFLGLFVVILDSSLRSKRRLILFRVLSDGVIVSF